MNFVLIMSFFIASCSILNKETKLSCHPSFPFEDVCVIDDNGKLIAINDTDKLIKVQLFIDDIHNVELTYRSPFVDVVPAFSQKTILNYKAKDENFLLHYDWIWGEATPTQ